MKEFNLNKKNITILRRLLVVFLALLAFVVALPFLPEEEKFNPNKTIYISLMGTAIFGFFTAYTWLSLRKLPFLDIVTDEDGIWYKHKGKEQGLISWTEISKIKERGSLQCLDLFSSNGVKLIRIAYALNNYEILRNIITEKICVPNNNISCTSFSKSIKYHLIFMVCIIGLSGLGLYIGVNGNPLLGYVGIGLLVASAIYEYAISATSIKINDKSLEISYPIGKREIYFSDITDIQISDFFLKGARYPEVWVITQKANKPYKLSGLGVDASVLYSVLRNTVEHEN